jgi:hypothetical protein
MVRTTLPEEVLLEYVRLASERRDEAEADFRQLLAAAHRAGLPLSLIAYAAKLSVSRVHSIIDAERELVSAPVPRSPDLAPASKRELLVVAGGRAAVRDFHDFAAYVFQANRSFRDVERMGFYRRRQVEPHFPSIRHRWPAVEFSRENADRLRRTGSIPERELADLVDAMLDQGRRVAGQPYGVFLLTEPDDPLTLRLPEPVPHMHGGRGSAWTQGTRYISEASLLADPRSTDDLH